MVKLSNMNTLTIAVKTVNGIILARGTYRQMTSKQRPSVQLETSVSEPYWFVRIVEPVTGENGFMKTTRRKHNLGPESIGRSKAEEKRDELLKKLFAPEKKEEGKELTFAQAVAIFREGHLLSPGVRRITRAGYDWFLRRVALPRFGKQKLADIGRHELQVWFNGLTHLASTTRRLYRARLSSLFEYLIDCNLYKAANPARKVKIPMGEGMRKRVVPPRETMLAVIAELKPVPRMIAIIALTNAMRISEVLGLRWSAIDLETGFFEIRERWSRGHADKVKVKASERRGKIRESMMPALRAMHAARKSEWVFPSPAKPLQPLSYVSVYTPMKAAAQRLGVDFPGFALHTLRRAGISGSQELASLNAIQASRLAGHSGVNMTLDYTELSDECLAHVVETIGGGIA